MTSEGLTRNARRRRSSGAIVAAIGGLTIALTLGYLLKAQCLTHAWDGFQYRSSCYNDIYALADHRGLNDGRTPYLDGNGLDDGPDGDLEYPVGTGLIVWIAGAASSDGSSFFFATAMILAVMGAAAGMLLIALARDRWRLALVFAAPPLVLYSFHNWDLLPMLLVMAAVFSWRTGRTTMTGVWLGLGAASKVYPGLLLPAFLLHEGRRTGRVPWKMVWAAAISFVFLNLPIAVANLPAWLYPWRFQSTRFPNFETHWYFLFRHAADGGSFWSEIYPNLTSVVSGLLFIGGLLFLLHRENKREQVRPVLLGFAILVWWLLTAKVYSPQFSLWFLPFFALVAVPKRVWVATIVTDAAVWAAVSFFFLGPDSGTVGWELRLWLLELATFARYAALIWLLRAVLRGEERIAILGDGLELGSAGDGEQTEALLGGSPEGEVLGSDRVASSVGVDQRDPQDPAEQRTQPDA